MQLFSFLIYDKSSVIYGAFWFHILSLPRWYTGLMDPVQEEILAKLTDMWEFFQRFKPMLERFEMVNKANNLRQVRKAIKDGR